MRRLARIREERGLTQNDVAERTGLIQTLVSDDEPGRLRLDADMIVRFAVALEISTDELLRPKRSKAAPQQKDSRKVLRPPPSDRKPASLSARCSACSADHD
ncbi:MAG: helix-turn-helix transcriptional regulator [Acidobacteria bacterium]|nr:helix-turn-helix transcriptional regulator [Acidobacteriota bacterium]